MPDLSDGQQLLLVLWLLYLSDCFTWVRRQAVVFVAPFCREWRIAKPSGHLGNARGNLYFLNPLPPFGEVFSAGYSPFSLSPDGVCRLTLGTPPAQGRAAAAGAEYAFETIDKVETDGADVHLNGKLFAPCADPMQARELAALVSRLRKLPRGERAAVIERHLRGRFSKAKAHRAIQRARAQAWHVRTWCLVFFVVQYGTIPVLALFHDLRLLFLPAAGVYLLGAWVIAILYFRTHKRLFPELGGERWGNAVKLGGCPPLALRAADLISLHALSAFHPLLVADLLQARGAREHAALFVRDLRHPLRHELSGGALEIAQWHADAELAAATAYLAAEGSLDPAAVFEAPEPADGCTKYCPRCRAQFLPPAEQCSDCRGVELKPFALEAPKPEVYV